VTKHGRSRLRRAAGGVLACVGIRYFDLYRCETLLPPSGAPATALTVRPALPEELPELRRRIWGDARHDRDDERALALGGECWLALQDGQVAGCSWINRRVIDLPGLFTRPLERGWAYQSHSNTVPEFRGRGVFQTLIRVVGTQLARDGFTGVVNYVDAWNLPSIAARTRTGATLTRTRYIKLPFVPPLCWRQPADPGVR
jgi:GNAT superfamily N-acetyltransferase